MNASEVEVAEISAHPELTEPTAASGSFIALGHLPSSLASGCVKVLMLYEDLATGNRAMRFLDSLRNRCGKELQFQSDMWKFNTLRYASLSELAAQDARAARVIIISAHAADELPDELKAWFDGWIGPRVPHLAALVALLDHSEGFLPEWDASYIYLEQIAEHAGMEFIAIAIQQEETDWSIRHAISGTDEAPTKLKVFCQRVAYSPIDFA